MKLEKALISSGLLYIEYVVLLLIIIFISNPFSKVLSFYNILFFFLLFYIPSIFLIKNIFVFPKYLIIFYPTRFFLRKRKIKYSEIEKIKYIFSNSAYSIPEIHIIIKQKKFPIIFVSLSFIKRKQILNILNKLGLTIEIHSDHKKDKNLITKD